MRIYSAIRRNGRQMPEFHSLKSINELVKQPATWFRIDSQFHSISLVDLEGFPLQGDSYVIWNDSVGNEPSVYFRINGSFVEPWSCRNDAIWFSSTTCQQFHDRVRILGKASRNSLHLPSDCWLCPCLLHVSFPCWRDSLRISDAFVVVVIVVVGFVVGYIATIAVLFKDSWPNCCLGGSYRATWGSDSWEASDS